MPILKPGGGTFDGGGASGDWENGPGRGVSDEAVSFVMNDGKKRLAEAASYLSTGFGGAGGFTNIAAKSKTFTQMNAAAVMKRGVVSPNTPPITFNPADKMAIDTAALTDLSGLGVQSTEPAATASQINQATGQTNKKSQHRVKLVEKIMPQHVVEFDVMPEIMEQHTVEYEALAPPQFPGAFQKYKGNSSTQWQLTVMFISRNSSEATKNYKKLMMLRGWTKPFYGARTGADYSKDGAKRLGAPPPTLMLSGLRNLIGPMPVVITSLNWSWPKDVDYIATGISGPDGNYVPFPTVMSVPIQLVESYSIDEFNQFSLAAYREGDLTKAFHGPITGADPVNDMQRWDGKPGPGEMVGGDEGNQEADDR